MNINTFKTKIMMSLTLLFFIYPYTMTIQAKPESPLEVVPSHIANSWLGRLNESPDFIEDWEDHESLLQADSHKKSLKDDVTVQTKRRKKNNLNIELVPGLSQKNKRYGLKLNKKVQLDFPNGITYLGIDYYSNDHLNKGLKYTFTFDDKSTETYNSAAIKDELSLFLGFTATKNKKIVKLAIQSPKAGDYGIDNMYWGRTDIEPTSCNIHPNLLALQCEDKRWVFDVAVSSNKNNSWWCVNDDDNEHCGSYGESVSFGYFEKTTKPLVNLTFKDQMDSTCQTVLPVKLPTSCEAGCQYIYESGKEIQRCTKKSKIANANLIFEH